MHRLCCVSAPPRRRSGGLGVAVERRAAPGMLSLLMEETLWPLGARATVQCLVGVRGREVVVTPAAFCLAPIASLH